MNRYGQIALVGLVTMVLLSLAGVAQDKPKADAPKAGEKTAAPAKPAAKGEDKADVDTNGTYKVDPVHSTNVFRIKHMNTTFFYGRFNEMAGTFVLDADPAKCSFDVTIKTDSIDSNNPDRNKHLKSPDFFDAEKYPTIHFKSKSVKKVGADQLEVAGEMTLHGETKPLTVKIDLTGAGPGMKGETRAGFETTFTIKRTDFGMSKMVGPVGDEVRLTVSVEGVRE